MLADKSQCLTAVRHSKTPEILTPLQMHIYSHIARCQVPSPYVCKTQSFTPRNFFKSSFSFLGTTSTSFLAFSFFSCARLCMSLTSFICHPSKQCLTRAPVYTVTKKIQMSFLFLCRMAGPVEGWWDCKGLHHVHLPSLPPKRETSQDMIS